MPIRSLLRLAVMVAILVTLGLGATLWRLDGELRRIDDIHTRVDKIHSETRNLQVLALEYALHGESRSARQWLAGYKRLYSSLDQDLGGATGIRDEAVAELHALSSVFDQLTAAKINAPVGLHRKRMRVLMEQFESRTQTLSETAQRWRETTRERQTNVTQWYEFFAAIGSGAALLSLVLIALLFERRVLRPLKRFDDAMHAVARGDLSVRCATDVNDEFGRLGSTFDALAVDLVGHLRKQVEERTQAMEALQSSEERFAYAADAAGFGAFSYDLESARTYWSPQYLALVGAVSEPNHPVAEECMFPGMFPDDAPGLLAAIAAAGAPGGTGELRHDFRVMRARGELRWLQVRAGIEFTGKDGARRATRMYGVVLDINERKQAELMLRTRLRLSELGVAASLEEVMQEALEAAEMATHSQIGFFHFVEQDQQHLKLQVWSRNTLAKMCTAEGKDRHYPISEAGVWVECFHTRAPVVHNDYAALARRKGLPPGHAPVVRELVVPVLRNGLITEIMGVGNKAADYVQADVDAVQQIASMVQDVVDRRRMQSALKRSVEEYESLLRITSDGFWVVGEEDRLLEVNDAYCRMCGYSREEMLAMPSIYDLVVVESPEVVATRTAEIMAAGALRFEAQHRHKNGGILDVEISAGYLPATRRVFVFIRDMSERKHLELVRLRSQRMEALGTLAGGIAHDFNNILAAIRGNNDIALKDYGHDHPATVSLLEIEKACVRASALVRRIMMFGRPKKEMRVAIDLQPVVVEALALLRPTIPAMVVLSTDFSPDTPAVLADATQVHEVVVNLTTNAVHAIGARSGKIDYRLSGRELEAAQARALKLGPGFYACLSVSDNGAGMDEHTMMRIFDAFFSTKSAGAGTGLGLSMVYGVMQAHAGAIRVNSAPGAGACFELYFPASAAPVEEEAAEASVAPRQVESRRVMYVDDEESLVYLIERALAALGHSVSGFVEPAEALAVFRSRPQDFDVVITDLSMPGIDGLDLAREVLAVRGDIPVLVTTGLIQDEDVERARAIGVRDVVLKPATVGDLAAVLAMLFPSSAVLDT